MIKNSSHAETRDQSIDAIRSIEQELTREGIPLKLYRSTTWSELFLVRRDGEIPMQWIEEENKDSGAAQNSVLTYWFDKPYRIDDSRDCVMFELETARLSDPKQIKQGEMRFEYHEQPRSSYEEDRFTGGYGRYQMDEFYIQERVPFSSVSVSITIEQDEFRKHLDLIIKDLCYNFELIRNGSREWMFSPTVTGKKGLGKDFIKDVISREYGDDPINFPPNIFKRLILDYEDPVRIGVYSAKNYSLFKTNQKRMFDEGYFHFGLFVSDLYIKKEALGRLIENALEFFTYIETLPVRKKSDYRTLSKGEFEDEEE